MNSGKVNKVMFYFPRMHARLDDLG